MTLATAGAVRDNHGMDEQPHQFTVKDLLLLVALVALAATLWLQPGKFRPLSGADEKTPASSKHRSAR